MKLTILGSGTCVPTLKRGSPSILLEIGKFKILLDIGPGALRQLVKVQPKIYQKIDYVFLSHHHPDHTSDLAPLIQALNWTPGFVRKKDLIVIAHPKMKNKIKNILEKSNTFKAKFIALKKRIRNSNIVFEAIKGNHVEDSLILKIRYKKKTLVYTADTDYDSKITKFASNSNLLIMENSTPENREIIGHLNSRLSGKMASLAKPKKLLLTHFYPPCEKYDIKKQVQKYYQGPIILAKDLMRIKI